MAMNNSYIKKDPATGDTQSSSIDDADKDMYKHFVSFMVDDIKYLIPIDNNNFEKSVISEELMNHIVHGRQKGV